VLKYIPSNMCPHQPPWTSTITVTLFQRYYCRGIWQSNFKKLVPVNKVTIGTPTDIIEFNKVSIGCLKPRAFNDFWEKTKTAKFQLSN
jgi:hypothetical protein